MRIPVYLFTGFLEAGKTQFVQELLEGDDFNAGERTLLLLCEEGLEKYREDDFFAQNVFIEIIEDKEKLTVQNLGWLQRKHRVERVIVEYNGMWMLDDLVANFPIEWEIAQTMAFFDQASFINYNNNLRQLVFDKLQRPDIIVFNRCKKDTLNRDELRKIVRGANRNAMILYEFAPGDVEVDQTPVELPYDLEANFIEIEDKYYAEWYRDINENLESYDGKKIKIKGRAVTAGDIPENNFIFGRHLMTCCIDDIEFAGFICVSENPPVIHGRWYVIEGTMKVETSAAYGGEVGPVLYLEKADVAEAAVPEVAAFY